MNCIDPTLLDIKRLKALRKSLLNSLSVNKSWDFIADESYKQTEEQLILVNRELARKQRLEFKKNLAHVPTVKEYILKQKHKKLDRERHDRLSKPKKSRAKTPEVKPGTTITFKYTQPGINTQSACGKFIYDTPELAKKAAESMTKQLGFSNVKIM